MKAVIPYYKHRGETPKEALERLRNEKRDLKDEKLSYAGRLDPLAEGLLLVLVGDANKEQDIYFNLPKTYEFDVLFGWSTDTYDVLGKLVSTSDQRITPLSLMDEIVAMEGVNTRPYPAYSSKTVEGKPLFVWEREGKLDQITIPQHTFEIYSAKVIKIGSMEGVKLEELVRDSIQSVKGDFRQTEILACWEENLKTTYLKEYDLVTIEIECGSGTYMRQIAHELGESLSIPALASRIVRTSVGNHRLKSITL